MHRIAAAASIVAVLAVAYPAYAQGNNQGHKKRTPPSLAEA